MSEIRKFRIWFKVFDSFNNEIMAIKEVPEVSDIIENGMVMTAYTAADAVEQAKLEGPMPINRLPSFINIHYPLRAFACKVRPEMQQLRSPDICMHIPPCRGQCEGDPVPSPRTEGTWEGRQGGDSEPA